MITRPLSTKNARRIRRSILAGCFMQASLPTLAVYSTSHPASVEARAFAAGVKIARGRRWRQVKRLGELRGGAR